MPSFHLCFSTRDAERGRSRGPLIPRWGSFHSPPIRILQLLKKPKYFLPGIPSWLKQPATALWLLVFARSRGIVMRCGEGGGERPVGWFTRQEIPINHCPNLSKGSGGCSEFPLVVPVTWCSDAFFFGGGDASQPPAASLRYYINGARARTIDFWLLSNGQPKGGHPILEAALK